MHNTVRN